MSYRKETLGVTFVSITHMHVMVERVCTCVCHLLFQLILCVCEGAAGSSGTAPLLAEVPTHTGLVLAVGLRLNTNQ